MLKAKQLSSIKKYTTITNSLKEKLGKLAGTIDKQDQSLYRVECALHVTQQYLRRDCLEINGVPISSYANPNVMLKVNDTSPTQAFTTHEEFEDYLDQISNC